MDLLLPQGYSATVALELYVTGEALEVAQAGPESLILREPRKLPAGPARFVVTVDGQSHDYEIVLRGSESPRREIFYW